MKGLGLYPNNITYSILTAASERWVQLAYFCFNDLNLILFLTSILFSIICRNDDLEIAIMLLSQAKEDGIVPTLTMYKCIIGKSIEINCLHLFFLSRKNPLSFLFYNFLTVILSADQLFMNNNMRFSFRWIFLFVKKNKRMHVFQLIMNFNYLFCLWFWCPTFPSFKNILCLISSDKLLLIG